MKKEYEGPSPLRERRMKRNMNREEEEPKSGRKRPLLDCNGGEHEHEHEHESAAGGRGRGRVCSSSSAEGVDGQAEAVFDLRPLEPLANGCQTNDDIHSTISLCPLIKSILDTPQMQRLRSLSQLGVSQYAYINAVHTRFEHSLGVAHLAESMCRRIQARQPQLGVTEKDVKCVKMAGLCHDLGHGPFSHVYDGEFQKMLHQQQQRKKQHCDTHEHQPQQQEDDPNMSAIIDEHDNHGHNDNQTNGWTHEQASLMMFDAALAHLGLAIDETNLDAPLRQIGPGIKADCFGVVNLDCTSTNPLLPKNNVLTSRDLIFVKECIYGGPLPSKNDGCNQGGAFVGRPRELEFLYDIVNNRRSGLDVDRMDYYARDKRRTLGDGKVFQGLIDQAFVAQVECSDPYNCQQCRTTDTSSANTRSFAFATPSSSSSSSLEDGRHLMICFPAKLVPKTVEFFKTRFTLFSEVYTHKTAKAVEYMICDILLLADPYMKIYRPNYHTKQQQQQQQEEKPPFLRISQAMHDPSIYLQLRDSILDLIDANPHPKLQPAQALLRRLRARDLYKCVACERIRPHLDAELWDLTEEEIYEGLMEVHRGGLLGSGNRGGGGVIMEEDGDDGSVGDCIIEDEEEEYSDQEDNPNHNNQENQNMPGTPTTSHRSSPKVHLEPNDLIVEIRILHHGKKAENPVQHVRFLSKESLRNLHHAPAHQLPIAHPIKEDSLESHLPRTFLEKSIRLYLRRWTREKGEEVKECFRRWLREVRKSDVRYGSLSQPV